MVVGQGASVGSYSSGSPAPDNILAKYGVNETSGKISKIEQDITDAEKTAKKEKKKLEQAAVGKKAKEIAKIGSGSITDIVEEGSSANGDDVGSSTEDRAVNNIAAGFIKQTPEEVFALYDTGGSGLIDFHEFQAMLPRLGITVSTPKALRHFRISDSDGSGEIDLHKFKVALFAFDPDNGNSVGFTPYALLAPLDAFEMFDEDKSGNIDEDEFFFLLRFLGLKVSDEDQERIFDKYDTEKSGNINYPKFKKIWLRFVNVKKELTDRGIKIPKLFTRKMLTNMLEQIIDEEEDRERRAIAEAERWGKWQLLLKAKQRAYEKAKRRSKTELKSALDAGGSVWVFGTGPFGEFTAPAPTVLKQGDHKFEHYDVIREIWTTRVKPPPNAMVITNLGEKHARRRQRELKLGSSTLESGEITSTSSLKSGTTVTSLAGTDSNFNSDEHAKTSPFAGLSVAQSTAALWGRRVVSVTTSDSAAFAVSEQGEGYVWGGKSHWWFELRPDSYWQTHWRGATTERSRLLLQTTNQKEPDEAAPEEKPDEEKQEIEKLTIMTQYYGVWKPAPTNDWLRFIQHSLVPKIKHQDVKHSLEYRRKKKVEDLNKTQMLDMLYADIVLEKKVLGERQHRQIRQLELEILRMRKKGKKARCENLRREIEQMWDPLREIQLDDAADKRRSVETGFGDAFIAAETIYRDWREHIRKARDEAKPVFTPRGISLQVSLGGLTDRAGDIQTPRANDAAITMSAGANHVLLVHRSGQLYTWGVGASGRLGLDLTQGGNPQADVSTATVIQAFGGRPVIKVSAAYSHSAAITSLGQVYTWGSAATGKLGLGKVDQGVYCSVPTRVMLGSISKVKEVSCGAAHTACVTASGQLFVWGCGDGGRLGLGEERLGPQFEPVLVETLASVGEKMGSVSCGNAHTLALTAVREVLGDEGPSRTKLKQGGRIFQAGSTNVLGTFCPAFAPVRCMDDVTVRQVSAGYAHSCCCTTEGELYTWGNNRDGCLGLPRTTKFADLPQLVSCLYTKPTNLALGHPTRQSSVFDNLGSEIAVDGDRSGDSYRKCSCTQQDPQGWWEVDMGRLVNVHEVKIWNRCDEPADPSAERKLYAKRLFPCWIMASQEPFKDDVGKASLIDAMDSAVARAHLKEEHRCSVWKCPDLTLARFVRVQLEGFDFLHLAQVEVFGTEGARRMAGKVTHCSAGKYVTTAVMAAVDDPRDVDIAYKRAVQADAFNAEVLRQLETFFGAYDQWGRGDAIQDCLLCNAASRCEVCALKHEFRDELKNLPLGPGGTLQPLSTIAQFLLDNEKPAVNYTPPGKKDTGIISTVRSAMKSLFEHFQASAGTAAGDSDSDQPSKTGVLSRTYHSGGRGGKKIKEKIKPVAGPRGDGAPSFISNGDDSTGGTKSVKNSRVKDRKEHCVDPASGSTLCSSTSSDIAATSTTSTSSRSSSVVSGPEGDSSDSTSSYSYTNTGGSGCSDGGSSRTHRPSGENLTTSSIKMRGGSSRRSQNMSMRTRKAGESAPEVATKKGTKDKGTRVRAAG